MISEPVADVQPVAAAEVIKTEQYGWPYNFSLAIRLLRSVFDISQIELAARCHPIRRQLISKYENGHTEPTIPSILIISKGLGIEAERFVNFAVACGGQCKAKGRAA